MIDEARVDGAFRADRPRRERHLLDQSQRRGVEEGQHARDIVGHAEFRRRERESGVGRGDDDVAGHRRLAGAAPDAALDHGDDRSRMVLDRPDQPAQGIVPSERIAPPLGQFVDVVSGGPDLDARARPEDHGAHALIHECVQRFDDVLDQRRRKRVALLKIVEADRTDEAFDFGLDERHGPRPPQPGACRQIRCPRKPRRVEVMAGVERISARNVCSPAQHPRKACSDRMASDRDASDSRFLVSPLPPLLPSC